MLRGRRLRSANLSDCAQSLKYFGLRDERRANVVKWHYLYSFAKLYAQSSMPVMYNEIQARARKIGDSYGGKGMQFAEISVVAESIRGILRKDLSRNIKCAPPSCNRENDRGLLFVTF